MSQNPSPSPQEQVIQMARAHQVSRMVYVAASLGIADHLAKGPLHADELARRTGANPGAVFRLLRALAMLGLFTERSPRTFALTPVGDTLRSDAPGAVRATVLTLAGQWMWDSWREFPWSVQTGKTAVDKALGMPVFDFLGEHPDQAALFNDTMIGFHGPEYEAVARAFDFAGIGTLADIGGGTGSLIGAVLSAHRGVSGILFDLPHVAAAAAASLKARGLADRCRIVSGSFFDSVPPADAYMMSHIIHDWDEGKCLQILGNCRKASPKARVLIVEMVVPPGDEPHPSKMLDIVMLTVTGGQERTGEEYAALLASAGYRMTRIVPTESPVSVVEGVPAG
jgi:hypothetical protein